MARVGESIDLVKCSFCGQGEKQVEKLIAGEGGVYICNGCIDLCNDIIEDERLDNPRATEAPVAAPTADERRWRAAHHLLLGRLDRCPTVSEMAAELGWTQDHVNDAGRCVAGVQRQRGGQVAGLTEPG